MWISASGLAVVTLLALFVPAQALAGTLARASLLSGLVFEDQPQILEDKGAFRDLMNKLAADAKRDCGPLEIFGWEVAEDDQTQVDKLEGTIKGFFKKERFTVREVRSGTLWYADADAFSADSADKHLLALLALSPSATRERTSDLVLLLCTALPLARK